MGSDDREPTYRLREGDVAAREVEGETIVLDLHGSVYFAINASGTVLWQALTQGAVSRSGLVTALQQVYDVADERAAQDVDVFLSRCAAADLIVQSTDTPAE